MVIDSLFSLVALVFCWLTGIITLVFSAKNLASALLGLSYLTFGYAFLTAALTYSGWMNYIPHFYRTGNICWLLCMPLSWLYVRTAVTKKPLTPWDLVHFVPAALYLIDYFPIFILSGAHKAELYRADFADLDKMIRYGQGWLLPKDAQLAMRYSQLAIYWYLQVNLLFPPASSHAQIDRPTANWLKIYTLLEVSLFLPFIAIKLIGLKSNPWLSTVPPAVAIISSSLTLILNPSILYGRANAPSDGATRTRPTLDTKLSSQISTRLETLMKEEKPYLNPDYTLGELSLALDIPQHKLSAYMNQVLGSNFNEYINQWRIHHCLELIQKGETANLNQHGIAVKCGFNNRQTFAAAFKKQTGKFPSAFFNDSIGS
jgi:AraC-like DNA-binding protein